MGHGLNHTSLNSHERLMESRRTSNSQSVMGVAGRSITVHETGQLEERRTRTTRHAQPSPVINSCKSIPADPRITAIFHEIQQRFSSSDKQMPIRITMDSQTLFSDFKLSGHLRRVQQGRLCRPLYKTCPTTHPLHDWL